MIFSILFLLVSTDMSGGEGETFFFSLIKRTPHPLTQKNINKAKKEQIFFASALLTKVNNKHLHYLQ